MTAAAPDQDRYSASYRAGKEYGEGTVANASSAVIRQRIARWFPFQGQNAKAVRAAAFPNLHPRILSSTEAKAAFVAGVVDAFTDVILDRWSRGIETIDVEIRRGRNHDRR